MVKCGLIIDRNESFARKRHFVAKKINEELKALVGDSTIFLWG